jgi:hypothetical protein
MQIAPESWRRVARPTQPQTTVLATTGLGSRQGDRAGGECRRATRYSRQQINDLCPQTVVRPSPPAVDVIVRPTKYGPDDEVFINSVLEDDGSNGADMAILERVHSRAFKDLSVNAIIEYLEAVERLDPQIVRDAIDDLN